MSELTVMVPLGDREVEMRAPSDGALVVLARAFRNLPKIKNAAEMGEAQREQVVRNLGTLGKIVDGMVVTEDDKLWLEDAMVDGVVSAEDVFDCIRVAGEKLNGTKAPAKKAAAPVRRARGRAR
ncbi:MAG TPA: hypothetical protein VFW27_05275 [Actinoplanes sp.]|nr:hypothetical protein [Actinoplanes sp.]